MRTIARPCLKFGALAFLPLLTPFALGAQTPAQQPQTPQQHAGQPIPQSGTGEKNTTNGTNQSGQQGQDPRSGSKPASAGEEAASTQRLRLGALDPSTPPTDIPHNRPVIGLAMGGGGALAMSEIGALQWFEEHRIPVDVIAGTSMGSILAALYSTGKTPEQMEHIMTEQSVGSVFRIQSEFAARNFRRREDSREVPQRDWPRPAARRFAAQLAADRHGLERAAGQRISRLQRPDRFQRSAHPVPLPSDGPERSQDRDLCARLFAGRCTRVGFDPRRLSTVPA